MVKFNHIMKPKIPIRFSSAIYEFYLFLEVDNLIDIFFQTLDIAP